MMAMAMLALTLSPNDIHVRVTRPSTGRIRPQPKRDTELEKKITDHNEEIERRKQEKLARKSGKE